MLRKIETANRDHSASGNNDLDKFFHDVEDNYRKIQHGVVAKLADLRILSDLLNQSNDADNIKMQGKALLSSITDKAITAVSEPVFLGKKEEWISFYLNKAEWLLGKDRLAEALDAWEEVLKIDPDNNFIHSKLEKILKP